MHTSSPYYHDILEKLGHTFTDTQTKKLAEVISFAYNDLVKTSDFNELKGIVKELAEAQKRTEYKVEELSAAMKELSAAMKELAQGQKTTEFKVDLLDEKTKQIREAVLNTNQNLGGLSSSVSYALENEAYRMLPQYLLHHYQITISSKMVRTEINKEEINIFGRGTKDGKEILIIGEAALKLLNTKKFAQLDKKVIAVKKTYKNEIFKLLITHYAKPLILEKAKQENITIIQSFEW